MMMIDNDNVKTVLKSKTTQHIAYTFIILKKKQQGSRKNLSAICQLVAENPGHRHTLSCARRSRRSS